MKMLLPMVDYYSLDKGVFLDTYTVSELAGIYNGAGPDWMSEKLRKVLTRRLDLFECAFLIHDVDFENADATRVTFNAVNKRMWANIRKVINKKMPMSDIGLWGKRGYWWFKGWAAYRACKRFGWSAWEDK